MAFSLCLIVVLYIWATGYVIGLQFQFAQKKSTIGEEYSSSSAPKISDQWCTSNVGLCQFVTQRAPHLRFPNIVRLIFVFSNVGRCMDRSHLALSSFSPEAVFGWGTKLFK